MDALRLSGYWRAIDVIEGQAALIQLRIADYPNLTSGNKKRFFDFVYKRAYPNQERKALKVEDFIKIAKARGLCGQ